LVNSAIYREAFASCAYVSGDETGYWRSLRLLTEYLEQHSEAILKGKSVIKGDKMKQIWINSCTVMSGVCLALAVSGCISVPNSPTPRFDMLQP